MSRASVMVAAALTLLPGCIDSSQDVVVAPLFVAGTTTGAVDAAGGVTLSLDRADLAFGPLYLCAGATAGDLCDTARAEWLESVVVDTLDATPTAAGEIAGVSGPIGSYMYDLAISSQLTNDDPARLEAAETLGASFVVSGRADVAGRELPFRASIDIQQTDDTELGVPVIRRSGSETFGHDLQAGEAGLLVRFDPSAWLETIDFRPYAVESVCAIDGPLVACNGEVASTCDPTTGAVDATQDCAAGGQVCQGAVGCVDAIDIAPDSEAFRALRIALFTAGRPQFDWGFTP